MIIIMILLIIFLLLSIFIIFFNANCKFQGVPTHDQTGEPLSGKLIKKLKKMYQQQEKLYTASQATANGSTQE